MILARIFHPPALKAKLDFVVLNDSPILTKALSDRAFAYIDGARKKPCGIFAGQREVPTEIHDQDAR